MRSVTKLDQRRGEHVQKLDQRRRKRPSRLEVAPDDVHGERDVADLLGSVDDHTRMLLDRRRTERRARLVPRSLMLADLVGLCLAYLLATLAWGANGALGSSHELLLFVLTLPCWVVLAKLHGLYTRDHERTDHSTTDDVVGVFHLVTVGVWLLLVASRLTGRTSPGIYALMTLWGFAVCVVAITRTAARRLCKRTGAYQQNTVIVGAGEVGQLICRKLVMHPEYGLNVVGFVDRDPRARRPDLPEHLTVLGGPERLPHIIASLDVERLVIAFSSEPTCELISLLRRVRALGVQIDVVPRLFELLGPRVEVHQIEGMALLGLPPNRDTFAARSLKRLIDVVGASAGLLVLSPLLAFIAVRVRLDSPGPILFRQTRLGSGMKQFTTLKFRTMKVSTDDAAHRKFVSETMSASACVGENGLYKLDRSDAVTTFGRWLRRTSLDELPQLFNVLTGDMSLVGPRPCIPYEIENFEPHHLERFLVPQGLTGLWQVTARASSSYGEALDMDVAYVRSWSLGLDLQLLLRTPLQVLRQRSATA